ncbi:MAG: hypothetical protein IJW67_01205, partial [Blautia sp.]|nr:hypothetical protein [Blautia sp.]
LCVLLLAGFILVAVKLLFLDDAARRNALADPVEQETEADISESELELSGESVILAEDDGIEVGGETLIENPEKGLADAADYDLTVQSEVTLSGRMYMHGSEKEMLLTEPKSFYGKNATGTKVLVSQADTVHFASSQSKVSVEELRTIPNGADLTCTGSLYIHDDVVFMRLESVDWRSWEEEAGLETEAG